jgi:arylsulfatase A-like enzyme
MPAPHTPILPTKEFQGKSGTNPYGDFVLEVDYMIGQVMKAVEKNKLSENTLIIVTSDNGCSPAADFKELAKFNHDPSYVFRGEKADIFEGGHRIPFIVRWPGKVKSGTSSDQTICLTDLLETCAAIVGDKLPSNAGEDSYNLLPLFLNSDYGKTIREATVHHSINGSFSLRKGKWKLEMCSGSGGWSYPTPKQVKNMDLPPIQLYDLENDISEEHNVYDKYPEVVKEMEDMLKKYISDGRSTPGESQKYVQTENWPGIAWMKDGNN